MTSPLDPEQRARQVIDALFREAGWVVQSRDEVNLQAGRGVAVRELPLKSGHGRADYLLFLDERPVGVLEAKALGHPLGGVAPQTRVYAAGVPTFLKAPVDPLPFLYRSTGALTQFTNLLDPDPRSREVYRVHRPETLEEWLVEPPIERLAPSSAGELADRHADAESSARRPSSLRARFRAMPPLAATGLWPNQERAIRNLEASLAAGRPRALIQMATGSGKTVTAIGAMYRLIKHARARRVLFLVDRTNLGRQAETALQGFVTPDDHRRFTELYNVERLTGGTIAPASKVVVTTIQRLYSILRGEPEFDALEEEGSLFGRPGLGELTEPLPVVYNAKLPPEFFDVVFIDECHRSIYSVWRQVLDYFDAFLIGLTATPAAHTYGFFNGNVVMEYGHEQAVADGVNVPFEIYSIRTRITEQGSTIEASREPILGLRSRTTGARRWVRPDEDVVYAGSDLDRAVMAEDQIRLIARTFRDRLPTEIFPGRGEVPKTLVYAKDDRHAEDIAAIFREEFGQGDDFCQKITYKTTGKKVEDLITEFRNGYLPRIAVTVDMIATGTDIRPIEIVMFLRAVKSRVLFEQMKGRGVRVAARDELRQVTPSALAKHHFVIVDCVGLTETDLADTRPLERKRSLSLAALLEQVALGACDEDLVATVAGRLLRLDRELAASGDESVRSRLAEAAGGVSLAALAGDLVRALSEERAVEAARGELGLEPQEEVPEPAIEKAADRLLRDAVRPLATNPALRRAIVEAKRDLEQMVDVVSRDELLAAGATPEALARARELVSSFEAYLAEHGQEHEALRFFYAIDYRRRPRFEDVKRLAEAIQAPPRSWTPERLWRAYELLDKDRVRGATAARLLTDVVSLVRFALHRDSELVPFPEQVERRFAAWLVEQEGRGRRFTAAQRRWLEMMKEHIATSFAVETDDFTYTPFVEEGGIGKARQVFGEELGDVMRELNEVLAA